MTRYHYSGPPDPITVSIHGLLTLMFLSIPILGASLWWTFGFAGGVVLAILCDEIRLHYQGWIRVGKVATGLYPPAVDILTDSTSTYEADDNGR